MVDVKDIKFQYDGRTLLDVNDGRFVGIANGGTQVLVRLDFPKIQQRFKLL